MRNNQVSQIARGEQAFGPNKPGGHDMGPDYARRYVIDVAGSRMQRRLTQFDSSLAAAATGPNVTVSMQIPQSPEVQRYAEARQLEQTIRDNDLAYRAETVALQGIVAQQPAQPQAEQQGA